MFFYKCRSGSVIFLLGGFRLPKNRVKIPSAGLQSFTWSYFVILKEGYFLDTQEKEEIRFPQLLLLHHLIARF